MLLKFYKNIIIEEILTRKGVANVRNFNVFALLVVAANFKHQSSLIGLNFTLRDLLHNVAHCLRHALLLLCFWLEKRVQHSYALREHCYFQFLLLFEVINKLAKGHFTSHFKTIPQSPCLFVVLLLLGSSRLRKCYQRKGNIDKSVLVSFDVIESKIIRVFIIYKICLIFFDNSLFLHTLE